jgi:hypothetical protein
LPQAINNTAKAIEARVLMAAIRTARAREIVDKNRF